MVSYPRRAGKTAVMVLELKARPSLQVVVITEEQRADLIRRGVRPEQIVGPSTTRRASAQVMTPNLETFPGPGDAFPSHRKER
jgi:hypothetical protein